MVRAKFKCVKNKPFGEGFDIEFYPVIGGSPENDEFYKYTPSGHLTMCTVNAKAASEFVEGQEYFLDIHPA